MQTLKLLRKLFIYNIKQALKYAKRNKKRGAEEYVWHATIHATTLSIYIFAYKCMDSSWKDEQTGKTMVVSRKNRVTSGQGREGDFHAISFCSFIIVPCDYYLIKNTFKVEFLKWCQSGQWVLESLAEKMTEVVIEVRNRAQKSWRKQTS